MAQRLCECGEKLGSMNRSPLCFKCRQKREEEAKAQARRKQLEIAKAAGRVLLHTCLSDAADRPYESCLCRKYVTFEHARQMVKDGIAVDFETRKSIFGDRAILELGKRKKPPTSTLGQRVAIERVYVDHSPEEIERLKAITKEDHAWKAIEASQKIEIEHELETEWQKSLIVEVPAEEFDRHEADVFGRPGIFVRTDDRTPGGIGVDVISLAAQAA